jgi:hypothetical protein
LGVVLVEVLVDEVVERQRARAASAAYDLEIALERFAGAGFAGEASTLDAPGVAAVASVAVGPR